MADPILRLFIEDLHERLSIAHSDASRLHQLRAVDAATIARLSTELGEKEDRLAIVEEQARTRGNQVRSLMAQVHQLNEELSAVRRQIDRHSREGTPE